MPLCTHTHTLMHTPGAHAWCMGDVLTAVEPAVGAALLLNRSGELAHCVHLCVRSAGSAPRPPHGRGLLLLGLFLPSLDSLGAGVRHHGSHRLWPRRSLVLGTG